MANPENKQIPYESTQKDIRDAIESVATAIGGIAVPSADHVSYDNSGSGLSATDVQNALDEIVSDLPTVNNGTLTIQQNGTSIGSFSANTASNVTANIKTPTAEVKTATDTFTTVNGGLLEECIINLVPVQDLHGYDSPWVGGVGKNKLQVTANSQTINGITYTVNSDGTILAKGIATARADFYIVNSVSLASGTYILTYGDAQLSPERGIYMQWEKNGTPDTVVNSVTFTEDQIGYIRLITAGGTDISSGVLIKPMIRLSTESDSTFAPYENICPISGHTEVNLFNVGKNLFDNDIIYGERWNGTYHSSSNYWTCRNLFEILPNTTYTFSGLVGDGQVGFYDENQTFISSVNTAVDVTFTTPENAKYLSVYNKVQSMDYNHQLELGTTATPYEPYLGHLYQVQIGSTVYGGYVDLVSGVMTVTQKSYQYSDAPVPTTKDDKNRWSFSHILSDALSDIKGKMWDATLNYDWCSSELAIKIEGQAVVGKSTCAFYGHNTNVEYRPRIADTYTAEQAQQIVRDNVIVYQINPYTIQLTPQQIETLAGQNNLSTPLSGQSIETNGVEYKELFTFADVKEYVDKKIPDAPTTDGTYTLQAVVSGGVPTYSWV